MEKSQIVIATISWARDEQEERLLIKSLTALAQLQIPVFITDAGSSNNFLDFLTGFAHFTVLKPVEKGLFPQAKTSLIGALDSGAEFILYTEPDKFAFFENFLPQLIEELTTEEQTGVVLFSRSEEGFATFPAFQQMTETTINYCCQELIGKNVDYAYGPFLLNKNLVPRLQLLPSNIGWGWRPYAFTIAHHLGYKVDACVEDFVCPEDQRTDSPTERIYRMKQLTQNIEGITLAASADIMRS